MMRDSAQSQPCTDAQERTHEPLRVLDLFSGIGGFSLGLERAGFETVAFCEISAKCRHLLKHHWPEVPAYDDVCSLTAGALRADGIGVDAICGGFPCQDISYAGKGAGLAGERSGLWREYARLIRELRPRFVFVENVAALLSRGLGDVLGDLASLGYDAWWDCIPASALGAPHQRDRFWMVAWQRDGARGFGDAFRRAIAAEIARAHPNRLRLQGQRSAARGTWSQQQFARLVQVALRDAVPTRSGSGVHDGLPERPHALHGLGNAVVPEIPYRLGRAVLTAQAQLRKAA